MGKIQIRPLRKKCLLIIFFYFIILEISCSKNNETYKAEIKNGIKIIENLRPKWGDVSRITL